MSLGQLHKVVGLSIFFLCLTKIIIKERALGNSSVVHWLQTLSAKSLGSIAGRGTKISLAVQFSQKEKKKKKRVPDS